MESKVALVAGGAGSPGAGIVAALLAQGTTVIVPVPDAASLHRLQQQVGKVHSGRLITYPADFGDYEKAEELIEIIVSEYGHIDLVVAAIEKIAGPSPLLYADIRDWHTALDCNITTSFVIDRLCLPLLGKNGGVLINISNADHLLPGAGSPLARLSGLAGIELSKVFAEEARPHHIFYYHLLVNNLATDDLQPAAGEQTITAAMIGEEVIRLYQTHVDDPGETFRFFIGKPLDASILNRLKG